MLQQQFSHPDISSTAPHATGGNIDVILVVHDSVYEATRLLFQHEHQPTMAYQKQNQKTQSQR